MLALLGFGTIALLFGVVTTNKLAPLAALILLPVLTSLAGGFGLGTGTFMINGIKAISPVAGMFVFAILFFGVMTDAGLMDPIIERILRGVGSHPTRIVVGSTLLALLVHLDGSGAVCFLVTIPAMLPLYERMGIDKRILACVVSLAAGVNFMPWTGPVIRAAAALKVSTIDIFKPLILVQIAGLIFVFAVAYALGKREERRLGLAAGTSLVSNLAVVTPVRSQEESKLRRPHLFWVNLTITLVVMGLMITGTLDPVIVFMVGTTFALLINYPDVNMQRARVEAHAKAAFAMASLLFAAGAFTGIMNGTKMLDAMAATAVTFVPAGLNSHLPFGLALISMPLSLLFDPDSYYFGVMPTVARAYQSCGGNPIHIAQASVLGQMTTGFPVSPLTPATFLITGLTGIDLGTHQRFSIPFLFAASVIMSFVAAAIGVFSS